MKRESNPPNRPQLRSIEHFWSIFEQLVHENYYQATSRDDLVQRIKPCVKKVDVEDIKKMMNKVLQKIHVKNHRSSIGSQPQSFVILL